MSYDLFCPLRLLLHRNQCGWHRGHFSCRRSPCVVHTAETFAIYIRKHFSFEWCVTSSCSILRPAEYLNIFLQHLLEEKKYILLTFKYFHFRTFLKDFRCTLMYLINRTFRIMTFSIKKQNKKNTVSWFYPWGGLKLHLFLCNCNHGWLILMWNPRVRQCSRLSKGIQTTKPIHGPEILISSV